MRSLQELSTFRKGSSYRLWQSRFNSCVFFLLVFCFGGLDSLRFCKKRAAACGFWHEANRSVEHGMHQCAFVFHLGLKYKCCIALAPSTMQGSDRALFEKGLNLYMRLNESTSRFTQFDDTKASTKACGLTSTNFSIRLYFRCTNTGYEVQGSRNVPFPNCGRMFNGPATFKFSPSVSTDAFDLTQTR